MTIEKIQIRKKAVAIFAADGTIERCYVTVDDGYLDDGKFISGSVRDIEADAATIQTVFGEANAVTRTHANAMIEEKDREIAALRKQFEAKIKAARDALA